MSPRTLLISPLFLLLVHCTPVKTPVIHEYQLQSYDQTQAHVTHAATLLISQTEAINGYQTERMLYMKTPFQLSEYRQNAWISPPATLFYPLLIQSFQKSHLFKAVASSSFADPTDYRLDTQLIHMEQRFLSKPSQFHFTLKATLTQVPMNKVIGSKLFEITINCPSDTPYGGVIAANQATQIMTKKIKQFVAHAI